MKSSWKPLDFNSLNMVTILNLRLQYRQAISPNSMLVSRDAEEKNEANLDEEFADRFEIKNN